MTRTLESQLTAEDRQWLAQIDKAMQREKLPAHVVPMERYCALLQSNEFITRENYRLRQEYKALETRFRESEARRKLWTRAAWSVIVGLGALWLIRGIL